MQQQPQSIGDHIDCLARMTGAPIAFVDQVRGLFLAKGISLDSDGEPFIEALEEAFRREERIRNTTQRARDNLAKLQQNFRKVGRAYVDQFTKKKKPGAEPTFTPAASANSSSKAKTTRVTIRGDHRTLVTRTEREELPMVPGPDDPQ